MKTLGSSVTSSLCLLLTTTFNRPGRGRNFDGIESQVFLPITTALNLLNTVTFSLLYFSCFFTFPLQRLSWLILKSCSAQISAATEESRPCLQRVCISFLPKRVCIAHLQRAVPADASTFTHGYDHVDLEMRLHFFWFLRAFLCGKCVKKMIEIPS